MIDEIANICFLKKKANRLKSNLSAIKFLKDCKEKNPEALEKQCIPEDQELWNTFQVDRAIQAFDTGVLGELTPIKRKSVRTTRSTYRVISAKRKVNLTS